MKTDIQKYLDYLSEKNYSQGSIKTIDKALRYFNNNPITKETIQQFQQQHIQLKNNTQFSYAVKLNGFLKHSYPHLNHYVVIPKKHKHLPQNIPTITDITETLQRPDILTYTGIRDRAILELLYGTGLRRAEVANLQTTDIFIPKQTLQVISGKGNKDRLVPIPKTALRWLSKYIDTVRDYLTPQTTALFVSITGKRFTPDTLYNTIKKYQLNPHKYRHAYATHLMENGTSQESIRQLLGHESLESTAVYTAVSIVELQERFNKLGGR